MVQLIRRANMSADSQEWGRSVKENELAGQP